MAGLNETPKGDRVHIAFFGLRNAGKSTLVNRLTGQNVAIVSDVAGTTTDPVSKAMEILPLGPCLVTDTAGLDDEGPLGEMRVKKSLEVLATTDIAVWVEECAATSVAPPVGVAGVSPANVARSLSGPQLCAIGSQFAFYGGRLGEATLPFFGMFRSVGVARFADPPDETLLNLVGPARADACAPFGFGLRRIYPPKQSFFGA